MDSFILNLTQQPASAGGNYEVHNLDNLKTSCHEDEIIIREDLGRQVNSDYAVAEAQARFPLLTPDIDGCYWCTDSHSK